MGWGVSPMPRPPLPPGKTLYPLYRRLSGPQRRYAQAENLVPTGIRSRTFQLVEIQLYSFLEHSVLDGVGGQPHAPSASTLGKTRYPLYRRLGGPQRRSGQAENLVPTGIRSRTVQPEAV